MSYCAIILAAGKGHRYSRTIPKQYTVFDNELILNYSLKIFSEIKPIKKIILVINRPQFTKFKDQVYKSKKITIIDGGKERKDSVFLALSKLKKKNYKKVLIHDAARPFLKKKLLNKIIKFSKKNDAVIPYITNTDTVVFKNQILDRKKVLSIQTPQCFSYRKYFLYTKNIKIKNSMMNLHYFFVKILKLKKYLETTIILKLLLKMI